MPVTPDRLKELLLAKKAAEQAYLQFPRHPEGSDEEANVQHELKRRWLNRAWTDAILAFDRACNDGVAL